MGDQKITLAVDGAGRAVHTRERTVTGPGVIQEQYVIPISPRLASGIYLYHTGAHVVQASAQNGTSTGFWWLYNTSSTVQVALRSVRCKTQIGSQLATPTSPRLLLQAFTFTGTPAGTAVTPRKTDTSFAAAVASLRTTQVTSVVTLTESVWTFLPVAALTAAGSSSPSDSVWMPKEDEQVILLQNQGVVCWQPDAGTASDTRRIVTDVAVSEFTVP